MQLQLQSGWAATKHTSDIDGRPIDDLEAPVEVKQACPRATNGDISKIVKKDGMVSYLMFFYLPNTKHRPSERAGKVCRLPGWRTKTNLYTINTLVHSSMIVWMMLITFRNALNLKPPISILPTYIPYKNGFSLQPARSMKVIQFYQPHAPSQHTSTPAIDVDNFL